MTHEVWENCYDETWHGIIVPDAFGHPAKMSRALLKRILDEFLARGYVKRGDVVVDPFGGVGTTGLEAAYRGLVGVSCELEERFVALAKANYAKHANAIDALCLRQPIIVCGDSRKLRAHVSDAIAGAVVSSPPYAVISSGSGGLNTQPPKESGQQTGRSAAAASQDTDSRYGTTDGQLSRLPEGSVAAVVSSPPYATGGSASAQSIVERTDKSASWVKANTGSACTQGYGTSDGQLAEMKYGLASDAAEPGTETFWSAARSIARECFEILRPGGYAAWVVKAFVKKGAIVDFPSDWRSLCEYVGFESVSEVRAMLVRTTETPDLFGGSVVRTTERKSFFRRNAESKGSPRIDWEVVLIMRRPE